MSKKVHMICAKCGDNENMFFKFNTPLVEHLEGEEPQVNIFIKCDNCGELTGLTEWNEFNGHSDKNI